MRGFLATLAQESAAPPAIAVIQQTPGDRAARLRRGPFEVQIRGKHGGEVVDRAVEVHTVTRALVADEAWPQVLELAADPRLRFVVSNVTEAGYDLADDTLSAPRCFVSRLAAALNIRMEQRQPGLTIVPMELVEDNAKVLRAALRARCSAALNDWIDERCRFASTLVDRIVTLRDELVCAEPYALWAIEGDDDLLRPFDHPAVRVVDDLAPFALRKIRILNGLHTAMVARFLPRGYETVREVVTDPAARGWLQSMLQDEILPVLEGRAEDPAGFAREVFERFENPFVEHRLRDIAAGHPQKLRARLAPTAEEYFRTYNRPAAKLNSLLED